MSIIRVPDRGGNCVSFRDVDGYWLPPPFEEQVFRDCRKLPIRGDDIILCAWMRSGTHWVFELVSMLLNNKPESVPKKKEDNMIEFVDIPTLDAIPSPRVLNTHLHFRVLPEDMKSKACRVIYLIRDPKDAAVSWYNMHLAFKHYEYDGKWADWLPLFLEGKVDWKSWFDHVRGWEHAFQEHPNLNVHFLHYEDIKTNTVAELKKLSQFLQLDRSLPLFEAISAKCDITQMRKDKQTVTWSEGGVPVHYRKGITGDWKNYFTLNQLEEFQRVYDEKMRGSRFYNRYNYIVNSTCQSKN